MSVKVGYSLIIECQMKMGRDAKYAIIDQI